MVQLSCHLQFCLTEQWVKFLQGRLDPSLLLCPLTHNGSGWLCHRSHASHRDNFFPISCKEQSLCQWYFQSASYFCGDASRDLFKDGTKVSGQLVLKAHDTDESPAELVEMQFPGPQC